MSHSAAELTDLTARSKQVALTGGLAEVRSATGITMFAGMIGVTLFGLFLTPVFYAGLRKLSGLNPVQHGEASLGHG